MANFNDAGKKAEVGDTLRVFNVNGGRMGWPADGYVGTVTKAGPKLFTVEYGSRSTTVFRQKDGRSNDAYRHVWVETPEQAALEQREAKADAALREHGVVLERRSRIRLTVEQLEALAEVARTFPSAPK